MEAAGMTPDGYGIEGVETLPLRVIDGPDGAVLHMLRADHPAFDAFGETYFSEVNPGATKGWKFHREMTQRLAVPVGQVVFCMKDGRQASQSGGRTAVVQMGRPDHYRLLVIPPGVWYAFRNPGTSVALIANVPDLPHSPDEVERRDLRDPEFSDVGPW